VLLGVKSNNINNKAERKCINVAVSGWTYRNGRQC